MVWRLIAEDRGCNVVRRTRLGEGGEVECAMGLVVSLCMRREQSASR